MARFRVHGEPVPDPRFAGGTSTSPRWRTAAALVACSDEFYGSAANLILPGRARHMGEGWENARRRDDGNDWALFRLAGAGVRRATSSSTRRTSSATRPASSGCPAARPPPTTPTSSPAPTGGTWCRAGPSQPDTRHRFLVDDQRPVTHVRLDVYPDGGMARLRVWGQPTD